MEQSAIRASYYTSLKASEDEVGRTADCLRSLGFDPWVFKKSRQDEKAKGVDIALTKDMLSHAFLANYEVAVLVGGDGDYVPLVQEVKRLGKRVHVWFFTDQGLNPDLVRIADEFSDLTELFLREWASYQWQNLPGNKK